MDASLLDAYRRTAFTATTPQGRLTIRVGERSAEVDALLVGQGVTSWAYVTAFNPGSVPLAAEHNVERQRHLEHSVAEFGYPWYPGEGIGDDRRWPPEPSLLVLGIGRADARRLGQQYGQFAIVYGELHGDAELLVCSNA